MKFLKQLWSSDKLSFHYFLVADFLLSVFAFLIVCRNLFVTDISDWHVGHVLYFIIYGITSYFIYGFIPVLIAYFLNRFSLKRTALIFLYFITLAFLVYVLADSYVYQIFHMHINWTMIQMTFLGGGQIVVFSTAMVIQIIILSLLCLLLALVVLVAAFYVDCKIKPRVWSILICIIALFSGSMMTYGYAYAVHNQSVTVASTIVPMGPTIRFNRLLVKMNLVSKDVAYGYSADMRQGKNKMNYPLHELSCSAGKDYNIVFIYIDSVRYDMLSKEFMPNAYEFAQQNVQFNDHFSGGINTRHGIFTLFTGLPGFYWQKALTTKTPSALVLALQQRNYAIGTFTGAKLTMPEFNQTVFASVPNLHIVSKGNTVLERDDNAVKEFGEFLNQNAGKQKFFSFIFFDNVHAYAFLEDDAHTYFKPYWKTVNNMELNNSFNPQPYFNRYKNAVRHADMNVGRVLKLIRDKGLLNNTIVVISSDHGEEFNDNGLNYWGHNGNFTKFQAKVPLVIHWPGKKASQVAYRTSNVDMTATLLPEVLGCKNPTSDYSVGTSLWTTQNRRDWLYISNYSMDAFVEPNRIILVNAIGMLEFLDSNYKKSSDTSAPPYMKQAMQESVRYLK